MGEVDQLITVLLDQHGQTYAKQAGIKLADKPGPLYQLLVLATLLSARISADIAVDAAGELFAAGYRTPKAMIEATWQHRVDALGRAHYRRHDERTATMLGDGASLLLRRWQGDLRKLRDEAMSEHDGDVAALLTEFPGIGPVGRSIFLREVQEVWPEVAQYVDAVMLRGARRIGLPSTGAVGSLLAGSGHPARLAAALVRVALSERAATEITAAISGCGARPVLPAPCYKGGAETEAAGLIEHVGYEAAELLSLSNAGGARSLCKLGELAAAEVPGCAGANTVVWRDTDDVTAAATHPDLAELADLQLQAGRGPLIEAARNRLPVRCPDLLDEPRWPDFADWALCRGIRCSAHLVRPLPGGVLVLALYGVRPGVLDAENPMADTLAAFGRAMLANATAYGEAQLVATQFKDAVAARSVVDQAKGILMHALGCDADDALRRLRKESQRRHLKVTEVASEVVRKYGGPA